MNSPPEARVTITARPSRAAVATLRDARDPTRCLHVGREDTLRVGRGDDAHLVLASRRISRVHALLVALGDAVLLVDAGSTNGTFVNGERVVRAVLGQGDVVRFDSLEFQVEYARAATVRLGSATAT